MDPRQCASPDGEPDSDVKGVGMSEVLEHLGDIDHGLSRKHDQALNILDFLDKLQGRIV